MALLDKFDFANKISFDDLYNTFLGLERRQQILVSVAAVVILILVITLPVTLVSSMLNQKESEYTEYLNEASELEGVLQQIKKLQGGVNTAVGSRSKGTDILRTVIYELAQKVGVQDSKINARTIDSKGKGTSELLEEVSKNVDIRNVSFDLLMKFLDKIETYDKFPIRIKQLKLKADRRDRTMIRDAKFTISTIKVKS